MVKLFQDHSQNVLLQPSFFEVRRSEAVGSNFLNVNPIAQFSDDLVHLRYNVILEEMGWTSRSGRMTRPPR